MPYMPEVCTNPQCSMRRMAHAGLCDGPRDPEFYPTRTITFTRARPVNQDAEWFTVVRHTVMPGDHPEPERTSEYLAPNGEWREFVGYEVIQPLLIIDGLECAIALGTGMRSKDWSKTWKVEL